MIVDWLNICFNKNYVQGAQSINLTDVGFSILCKHTKSSV